jgi:hypothetical protein
MSDYFDSGKFGAIVAIPFSKADMTTGESNTDLTAGQGTLQAMPVGGSVVGIAIMANASLTAGTITARAHSNSTEFADTGYPAPACSSAAQASYATVRPGAVTFDAGDKLGVSVTTTTTLDPTNSLDVDALLFVQLDPT